MGGFRDFCFIPELFPGEPLRLVKCIQNPAIADSILKMHLISSEIGEIGSSFPYCKSMGIVSKSDLSVSEHASIHDYIMSLGHFSVTRDCVILDSYQVAWHVEMFVWRLCASWQLEP